MNKMNKKAGFTLFEFLFWEVIILIVFLVVFSISIRYFNTTELKDVQVLETYVKRGGFFNTKKDIYMVVIKYPDGRLEVLSNEDMWFIGKFNSSDIQAILTNAMKNNKKCNIEVSGYRIHLLSIYRNIRKVECN